MATPDYLLAADNHNIASNGSSWYNPLSWDVSISNAPKFAAASVVSGVNSIFNSARQVGSWFGGDFEQQDTEALISSFDSDFGEYYRRNQESIDLAGFIGTSFIPGLAGFKAVNMGQKAILGAQKSGFIGGNLSSALGLLIPKTDKFVKLAAAEMNSTTAAAKLLNGNTLKAIASGAYQNTLEAAAGEALIQVTMFKSPILDRQDGFDIVSNMAVGSVFGGVVGGAFSAAKIRGRLKDAVRLETEGRAGLINRPSFSDITPAHEKITSLAFDSEMSAVPIILKDSNGVVTNNYSVNKQLYDGKVNKNNNEIRGAINGISQDTTIGNLVADVSMPIPGTSGSAQRYLENFQNALAVVRPGTITKIETDAAKAAIAGTVPDVIPAARWFKTVGENVGEVLDSPPSILTIADRFNGKEAIHAEVHSYKFSTTIPWNAVKLTGATGFKEAEARHIWASKILPKLPDNVVIHGNDIPLLERAYHDGRHEIKIILGDGINAKAIIPESRKHLYEIIKEQKLNLASDLVKKFSLRKGSDVPIELGRPYAAKIANIRESYIEGNQLVDEYADLFAHQSEYVEHLKGLKDRGLSTDVAKTTEATDPHYLPKYAKIVYDTANMPPQNVMDAVVYFKSQQKVYEQGAKIVVAKLFGETAENLPDIRDAAVHNADRVGSSAGLLSSENSNHGTVGSSMAWIGSVTRGLKDRFRSALGKNLETPLLHLRDNPAAAIEFEGFNQKATRSGKLWLPHSDDSGDYMITQEAKKKIDAGIETDPDDYIQITHRETKDAISAHIAESGKRTDSFGEIRAAQGREQNHDSKVFRPIRPDLKQYPHVAFVIDSRVTSSGHVSMIHAASEKELAALIDRVPTEFTVRTKVEAEEFYKARGEFEFSRTLNENYINSTLASKGVFSNFFPKSDPGKIVDDILQQHYRESDMLVQEGVRLRYEPLFNFFEDMGKRTSAAETSRFGASGAALEKTVDNPYFNYLKTALDISKAPENKLIYGFNKLLDESFSKAVGTIRNTWFNKINTPEQLDQINADLDKFGLKPAFYDSALQALANHTAPRGELTKFVRRANSLLSLFTLGLDPLNALNNAVGSNILRMTELRHITAAIASGDSKIAGEFAELAKINVPGTPSQIISPSKLMARAVKNYFADMHTEIPISMSDAGPVFAVEKSAKKFGPLRAQYQADGIIKSREDQLKLLIDDFTLKGTESVADLNTRMSGAFGRMKKWSETGEKLTLNAHAEEFNRFVSANVMDQISDIAIANGKMTSAEAKAYRNTFVNRVEGNILASQRPLIFQGPIGQAIGLFQSYQFNLIQQLFRYVAEGSKKDLAMLAGLQSTLYGIQSLPAFQAINTHIIGQLSGNKEHRDTYDAVYGTAGKDAGNFLLYGLPSNILQTNIYSRGDINPRHLTILPTSLQEIPIVAGWGKFFGSMYETTKKVVGGGNVWESILQGIEHNGISRPLAGLAQTLQALPAGQVYSTTSKGSILGSNDLLHLSTLSRLAGGRPLDEAVQNDAFFRVKSYEAARSADMKALSETVKTSLIGDETASTEQVNSFAQKYAELGGRQAGFNKWMMGLYKSTTQPQAEQLANSLRNPFAYKMQLLMGGSDE